MLWILTKKKKKKKKEREVGLENLKWFNLVNKHRSGNLSLLVLRINLKKTKQLIVILMNFDRMHHDQFVGSRGMYSFLCITGVEE